MARVCELQTSVTCSSTKTAWSHNFFFLSPLGCRATPVHPNSTDRTPPEWLPPQLVLSESVRICVICGSILP